MKIQNNLMSDFRWMVTPKSREVLGQCLLCSVLQSSHDVLTQTGLGVKTWRSWKLVIDVGWQEVSFFLTRFSCPYL